MSSVSSSEENLFLGPSMDSAKGRTGHLSKAAHCVDDTDDVTVSVTNPSTAAVVKPQINNINLHGRSTPASTPAEGLRTLAVLAKENLDREYCQINSALQKQCEFIKRSLNLEDLNTLKPANKKGKGGNYCRIIEIKPTQPTSLSAVHAAELEKICNFESSISAWQKRRNNCEIKWGERRPMLFGWTLSKLGVPDKGKRCVQCRSCEASTKCEDCFQFLCHKCDQQQHFLMPFHQRFCWKNGFFEHLDPTQTVCSDGNVIHWKPVVPVHPPNSCPNCNECKFTTLSSNNLCIFVTLSGRYDLYTPIFKCKCGYVQQELGQTMHQSGFYSSIGRKTNTFYSTNLLDSWHFLKRSSPGTSFRALVSALELFGASRGRHGPINFETTKRVFLEWCFHQHKLGRIGGESDNERPACDTTPLAVH